MLPERFGDFFKKRFVYKGKCGKVTKGKSNGKKENQE